jgi:S1-C subfamily serine protease
MRPRIVRASRLALLFSVASLGQVHPDAKEIFHRVDPAVVMIEVKNDQNQVIGHGSGFMIAADGRFLTNYHVIKHARSATVRLSNGDAYDTVEVLDLDKRKDIALLKIRAVDLPFIPLGKSADVQVGDTIFTVGTPLEEAWRNTFSTGIVSGIRSFDGFRLLQMTAPVAGGSSGGPVLNFQGDAVGIVKGGVPEQPSMNFAVPIDYARGMLASVTPQPLEVAYEAPPAKVEAVTEASEVPASGSIESSPPNSPDSQADAADEIRRFGLVPFLASKLLTWTEGQAASAFGKPLQRRYAYDQYRTVVGDIYSFVDPLRSARLIELTFDGKTKLLTSAFVYPFGGNVDQTKKLLGERFIKRRNPDGSFFHLYRDKRVNVLFDQRGNVVNIGLY